MRTKTKRCIPAKELASPPTADAQGQDEELARLAWAVAHPARVRILRILLARQACVCGELVGQMPLAQSTVSQHLKILKKAGLVQGEINGPKVCYCVNPDALARLKALVAGLSGARTIVSRRRCEDDQAKAAGNHQRREADQPRHNAKEQRP